MLLLIALGKGSLAQGITNKGKEFWVSYPYHYMFENQGNAQEMVLYLSAEQNANVTITSQTITTNASGVPVVNKWIRNYNIPAGTVKVSDYLPKAGVYDARLFGLPVSFGGNNSEGFFDKGIKVESDVPIVVYAHYIGSATSGAAMIFPVEALGYEYITINNDQSYSNSYTYFYVMAAYDNTKIQITPSVTTRHGKPGGVPFEITLNKFQSYQIIASSLSGDLTGSKIRSVANSDGECLPMAVFAGTSRTGLSCSGPGGGSGDFAMQQCFPTHAWGKRYLTAPTNNASTPVNGPASKMTNIYRVLVKDITTKVYRNGVQITTGFNPTKGYYQFNSGTADYIEADKPIMVAQYMSSTGACPNTGGDGDPEMIYISPIEQAINRVGFYRNDEESINHNYLTLIVPNGGTGLSSLTINGVGVVSGTLPGVKHIYTHPRNPDYSVVVRYWPSAKDQVIVQSDSAFTAITYGLGSVESYGYNGGTYLKNLNAESSIRNTPDTAAAASHNFNCMGTPVKLSILMRYVPTKLVWKISSLGSAVTPNADVTLNAPVWVDTPYMMGVKYYKYTLPDTYVFNDTGVFSIPVYSTSPTIDNCNNTEMVNFFVTVKAAPKAGFTFSHTGCIKDTVVFTGPATTDNGYNISKWKWTFATNDSTDVKDPKKVFADTGTYNVKLNVITTEGCTSDSIRPVAIKPVPTANFGISSPVLCQGGSSNFTDSAVFNGTAPISSWFWDFGNGNTATVGNNSAQTETYPTPGNYTVRHAVKVSDLCISDTVSKVLVVNSQAVPDSLIYPSTCLPTSGIADFSAGFNDAGGAAIVSYNWNFGDPASGANNTSTLRNPSHTFSTQGATYTVQLTITTTTGCSGDTSFQVTAGVTPVITVNSPAPICAGQPVTLTASGANTYVWTGPNLATTTGSSVTANPTTSASYRVVGTSNGCSDSADIAVTVNPVPAKPAVVTPVNYCQNATVSPLSATATAGHTLTWYDNPALTGGSATPPAVSSATPGTFKYYVTQSASGCTSEADTITVTVFPSIANNNVTADQTICAGSAASTLAGAAATGGNGTYVYQWQMSVDGGATWTNISGATSADYNPGSPTATTMYRRNVESGLCSSTSNVVTVTVQPGMNNFNIAANQTICEGAVPALIDGQAPTGGSGTYTYTWEVSTDNVNWTVISGATGEDYQPAALTVTTYFRRKVNGGDCVATSNAVTITINPFANGNIAAPASICQYSTADITFTAGSGTAPFEITYTITNPAGTTTTVSQTGVANNAVFNVIPAGSAAGNYTITLTSLANSNGCTRTTGLNSVTIAVTPTPVVSIAPVSPVCQGKSVTLTASGATSYTWSGPNLSATTGATVTATPAATQTYTVTGTTNGCNGTATIDVVVNPNPATAPAVSSTPVAYCQFATATPLTATPSAGHTLMWYDNAGLTGGSATAITPSTANAGSFTYYVTQVNNSGCESTPATITVQITAGVGGNTIGTEQTLCQGNSPAALTGTGTLTGGNGTFTYQWQQSTDGVNWSDITGATYANYSPGALNDTTWYRRNVSSNNCGSTSNVVVVNVYEGFSNYNISGTYAAVCYGSAPGILVGQAPGGAGPFTFTWQQSTDGVNWTDIPASNTKDYQPPALTDTMHYRRKVTNGPCTATSNMVTINVYPLPGGNFTAVAGICEYEAASVVFNATAGTGPYNISYTITRPDGTSITSNLSANNGASISAVPSGSAPGNYTIGLQSIESADGCVVTSGLNTVTITVHPTPVVTIAPPAEVCIGAPGTLSATGATSYAWTGSNLNGTTGSSVTATPSAPGTYAYSVVGTANGCVSAPATADLVVNPKPVASFTITDPVICLDEIASFTNTSTISSGSIAELYWDFDNGMLDTTSYTTSPISQAYTTHRLYNVKLKAISDRGCVSDQFIDDISVNPLPVASFNPPAYVCMPGGSAQFVNTTTIANGAAMSYTWNFGDPASGSFNTSSVKDGLHVYPDSATYTITLTATSAQGCSHQVSLPFNTFFNKPVARFSVSPDTLCQGIQNAFFDSSFAPGSSIERRLWIFGDGTVDSSMNPTKTFLNPGKFPVKLQVSNMQGCTSDTTKNVVVYLQPVIDAGQSFIVPQGTMVTFNGNANSGSLALSWTSLTGATVSNPSILKPNYLADQDAVFVLTATGEGNCTASDTISVKILRPITIPNAFSPNGDGVNDTWAIPNLADYPNSVVEVFNRYGQPVFRSFGYTKPWDGTLNGKELPVGTYYYIIDPKSGFPRMTGYVVILK